jgi:predicted nucleotidyltransferase
MIKNTIINRGVLKKIAVALQELNEQVVYVGGAVVSLYINDPAADDVRPTKDVDISVSLATLGELEALRENLTTKGFIQTAAEDVICRFIYDDVKVDVMNTKAIGWAPANPWFAPGYLVKQAEPIDEQIIHILPLPYFFASKFTAYRSRGRNEPRASHDFEDIVYILDNCTDIVDQLILMPGDVKPFLKEELQAILIDEVMQEAVSGNLFYENREARFQKIIENIKKIVDGI